MTMQEELFGDDVGGGRAASLSDSVRSLADKWKQSASATSAFAHSCGRHIYVAAGRPVRLQWEYRRSLGELSSLTDDYLRDLRIHVSNLPDVAWSEAHRRVDATTAESVAVGIAVLACAVAAAALLTLFSF
jgi:hypothetical protein